MKNQQRLQPIIEYFEEKIAYAESKLTAISRGEYEVSTEIANELDLDEEFGRETIIMAIREAREVVDVCQNLLQNLADGKYTFVTAYFQGKLSSRKWARCEWEKIQPAITAMFDGDTSSANRQREKDAAAQNRYELFIALLSQAK